MKFTTHFVLHSQATRLFEHTSYRQLSQSKTGFSPSMIHHSRWFIPSSVLTMRL